MNALETDFPTWREGLVYLDSSASAQKPREVIEAMAVMLARHYANIHRGVYPLAVEATDASRVRQNGSPAARSGT